MNRFFQYLIVINILSFVLFGLDKYFAVKNMWRISEKNLLLSALAGGGIGAYLGMRIFRHKTKHKKFSIGIPIVVIAEAAIYFIAVKLM